MNVCLATLALALAGSLVSMPASALVTRAFVSGGGSDANTAVNCSLTQPCRTFQNAMTVLTDGGEVIALDSAGYGTVNITKSVSLVAPSGIFAGITPTNGFGVTIDAADVKVNLRGLTINNQGGSFGIRMTNGAQLNLDNMVISGFLTGPAVSVVASAMVTVNNTTILNSNVGITVGGGATATVTNSRMQGMIYEGVEVYGGSSGTTTVSVSDTSVSGAGSGTCFLNFASSGTVGRLILTRVSATNCAYGVAHNPQAANTAHQTSVTGSTITGNTIGMNNSYAAPYGTFYSTGNNLVVANGTDMSGTITVGGIH